MKFRFKNVLSLKNCCLFNSSYSSLDTSASARSSSKKKSLSVKQYIQLIYYTFFFNEGNDSLVAVETMLQPFLGTLNLIIRYFGKVFVLLVWMLTLNMVNVFYQFILPEVFKQENLFVFMIHFAFGTWIVVNVYFHYVMGWRTNPGEPPNTKFDNVVTMCKKCIGPKPARTHHCSVCRKCVLKMDHHCPWFDNCIGFYNHRYFFMFCTFITWACIYLSSIGFYYYQSRIYPSKGYNIFSLITKPWMDNEHISRYHLLSTIEFFIIFSAIFAVGGLASFNFFIISNGTTNIEIRSINIRLFKTNDKTPNIYDLGFVNNWKMFLGFQDYKSFLMRVVLPSNHKPVGDGVNWYHYLNYPRANASTEAEIV